MSQKRDYIKLGIIYGSNQDAKTFTEKFVGHLINSDNFCSACEDFDQKIKCDKCRQELNSYANNIYYYKRIGENLPQFIDNPREFLPKGLPLLDYLLVIYIHQDLLSGLPEYLSDKNIKAVIIPIEDPNWVPPGLQVQVLESFDKEGIQAAFPKPFCALNKEEDEYNQINFNLTKRHNYIDKFIDYFQIGKPKISFKINTDGKVIEDAYVLISAPCGSTYFILQQLRSKYIERKKKNDLTINERISKSHHSYPCSASMDQDSILKDSILHIGGYIIRNVIRNELGLEIEKSKKLSYVIK
ncbi:MAG: hypothetical protein KGD57_04580 [Candidatus Lokiarchaeota archaeon]|nr:hypothetical protein [Candidatus Lokiarchaeota archaeon]